MKTTLQRLIALFTAFAFILTAEASFAAGKKKKKGKKKKDDVAGEVAPAEGGEEGASGDAAAAEGDAKSEGGGGGGGGYQLPYGMAGCGLGAVVMGADGNQIVASILNMSSGQPYSVTTGTSACSDAPPAAAMLEEQKVFIEENLASLTKEAAQGEGETLETLADVMGCDEEEYDTFATQTQAHHAELFENKSVDEILQAYQNMIENDERLADSCDRSLETEDEDEAI
jgi:hypothetical protein